ncbi:hypothetical protein P683_0675, partial [Acinetobacter baumannii UH8807]
MNSSIDQDPNRTLTLILYVLSLYTIKIDNSLK